MGSFRYCRNCGFDYEPMASNAADPTPAVVSPAPEAMSAPEAVATTLSGALPGGVSAAALPAAAMAGGSDGQPSPAGDVIAIPVQPLKRLAGAVVGGLVGAMLAGAVVIPFLGSQRIFLAVVAGIVTISVSALIGMRVVIGTADA